MSRTFSTSRIHREVIQAHGQSGSNQKSTLAVPVLSVLVTEIPTLSAARSFG
jgi:hypothetical protein